MFIFDRARREALADAQEALDRAERHALLMAAVSRAEAANTARGPAPADGPSWLDAPEAAAGGRWDDAITFDLDMAVARS